MDCLVRMAIVRSSEEDGPLTLIGSYSIIAVVGEYRRRRRLSLNCAASSVCSFSIGINDCFCFAKFTSR